jgi:hypothetical protein
MERANEQQGTTTKKIVYKIMIIGVVLMRFDMF